MDPNRQGRRSYDGPGSREDPGRPWPGDRDRGGARGYDPGGRPPLERDNRRMLWEGGTRPREGEDYGRRQDDGFGRRQDDGFVRGDGGGSNRPRDGDTDRHRGGDVDRQRERDRRHSEGDDINRHSREGGWKGGDGGGGTERLRGCDGGGASRSGSGGGGSARNVGGGKGTPPPVPRSHGGPAGHAGGSGLGNGPSHGRPSSHNPGRGSGGIPRSPSLDNNSGGGSGGGQGRPGGRERSHTPTSQASRGATPPFHDHTVEGRDRTSEGRDAPRPSVWGLSSREPAEVDAWAGVAVIAPSSNREESSTPTNNNAGVGGPQINRLEARVPAAAGGAATGAATKPVGWGPPSKGPETSASGLGVWAGVAVPAPSSNREGSTTPTRNAGGKGCGANEKDAGGRDTPQPAAGLGTSPNASSGMGAWAGVALPAPSSTREGSTTPTSNASSGGLGATGRNPEVAGLAPAGPASRTVGWGPASVSSSGAGAGVGAGAGAGAGGWGGAGVKDGGGGGGGATGDTGKGGHNATAGTPRAAPSWVTDEMTAGALKATGGVACVPPSGRVEVPSRKPSPPPHSERQRTGQESNHQQKHHHRRAHKDQNENHREQNQDLGDQDQDLNPNRNLHPKQNQTHRDQDQYHSRNERRHHRQDPTLCHRSNVEIPPPPPLDAPPGFPLPAPLMQGNLNPPPATEAFKPSLMLAPPPMQVTQGPYANPNPGMAAAPDASRSHPDPRLTGAQDQAQLWPPAMYPTPTVPLAIPPSVPHHHPAGSPHPQPQVQLPHQQHQQARLPDGHQQSRGVLPQDRLPMVKAESPPHGELCAGVPRMDLLSAGTIASIIHRALLAAVGSGDPGSVLDMRTWWQGEASAANSEEHCGRRGKASRLQGEASRIREAPVASSRVVTGWADEHAGAMPMVSSIAGPIASATSLNREQQGGCNDHGLLPPPPPFCSWCRQVLAVEEEGNPACVTPWGDVDNPSVAPPCSDGRAVTLGDAEQAAVAHTGLPPTGHHQTPHGNAGTAMEWDAPDANGGMREVSAGCQVSQADRSAADDRLNGDRSKADRSEGGACGASSLSGPPSSLGDLFRLPQGHLLATAIAQVALRSLDIPYVPDGGVQEARVLSPEDFEIVQLLASEDLLGRAWQCGAAASAAAKHGPADDQKAGLLPPKDETPKPEPPNQGGPKEEFYRSGGTPDGLPPAPPSGPWEGGVGGWGGGRGGWGGGRGGAMHGGLAASQDGGFPALPPLSSSSGQKTESNETAAHSTLSGAELAASVLPKVRAELASAQRRVAALCSLWNSVFPPALHITADHLACDGGGGDDLDILVLSRSAGAQHLIQALRAGAGGAGPTGVGAGMAAPVVGRPHAVSTTEVDGPNAGWAPAGVVGPNGGVATGVGMPGLANGFSSAEASEGVAPPCSNGAVATPSSIPACSNDTANPWSHVANPGVASGGVAGSGAADAAGHKRKWGSVDGGVHAAEGGNAMPREAGGPPVTAAIDGQANGAPKRIGPPRQVRWRDLDVTGGGPVASAAPSSGTLQRQGGVPGGESSEDSELTLRHWGRRVSDSEVVRAHAAAVTGAGGQDAGVATGPDPGSLANGCARARTLETRARAGNHPPLQGILSRRSSAPAGSTFRTEEGSPMQGLGEEGGVEGGAAMGAGLSDAHRTRTRGHDAGRGVWLLGADVPGCGAVTTLRMVLRPPWQHFGLTKRSSKEQLGSPLVDRLLAIAVQEAWDCVVYWWTGQGAQASSQASSQGVAVDVAARNVEEFKASFAHDFEVRVKTDVGHACTHDCEVRSFRKMI
eukprot:jgi/Mesvir1/16927/Mv15786-RA.2